MSLTTQKKQVEANNRRLYTRGTMRGVTLVFFGPAKWGKVINIGEGGMAFEFYELPPAGQRMRFDLQPMGREESEGSGAEADSIHVDGRVVWTRNFERCVGVQFLELSRSVREQISEALSIEPPSKEDEQSERDAIETGQDDTNEAELVRPPLTLDGTAGKATDEGPRAALAQSGNPMVVWEFGAAQQPPSEEPAAAKPWIGRAALVSMALRLAALAMVGWITIVIVSQRAHLAALFERMRERSTVNGASRRPGERAIAKSPLVFQVEAVDMNNKRRILRFDNDASALEAWTSLSPPASRTSNKPFSVKNATLAAEKSAAKKRQSLFIPTLGKPTVTREPANTLTTEPLPAIDSLASNQAAIVVGDPSRELLANTARQVLADPPVPASTGGQQARLISSVDPVYPASARFLGLEGDIIIDALIDATGKVTSMKPLSGPAPLQMAAMDALRRWKYEPARLNNQPVPSHLSVTVKFRLN